MCGGVGVGGKGCVRVWVCVGVVVSGGVCVCRGRGGGGGWGGGMCVCVWGVAGVRQVGCVVVVWCLCEVWGGRAVCVDTNEVGAEWLA